MAKRNCFGNQFYSDHEQYEGKVGKWQKEIALEISSIQIMNNMKESGKMTKEIALENFIFIWWTENTQKMALEMISIQMEG